MTKLEPFIIPFSITIITFIGALLIAWYNNRRKDKFNSQAKRIHSLNDFFMLLRLSHMNVTNVKLRYESLNSSNPIQRVIEIPYIDTHALNSLEFDLARMSFIVSDKYKKRNIFYKLKVKLLSWVMIGAEFPEQSITNKISNLDKFYSYIENYNYFIHTLTQRNKLRQHLDDSSNPSNSLSIKFNLEQLIENFGIKFINDIMMRTEHLIQIIDFLIDESATFIATYKELFGEFIDEKIRIKLEEPFLHGQLTENWGKGIYKKTGDVDYDELSQITGLDIDKLKHYYQMKF